MGPGHRLVRRGGRARRVPALGPSRRPVAIRLAHVEPGLGQRLAFADCHTLRSWHVSRRCGPQDRTTQYDPAECLGTRLGRRQRPVRRRSFGDAPHDAADRNAIEPPGRTDQSQRRWYDLVSNSPERRPGWLVERPLYNQLPNQPGLDRLAKDLAACWLSVPVGGPGEGRSALQERARYVALCGEWRPRPAPDGDCWAGRPAQPVRVDG